MRELELIQSDEELENSEDRMELVTETTENIEVEMVADHGKDKSESSNNGGEDKAGRVKDKKMINLNQSRRNNGDLYKQREGAQEM